MSTEIRLVSPSDIAELAGRTRAAVSNWRANPRLGFPEPAGGTEARPLFNLVDVEAWLSERQGITIERLPGADTWGVLNSVRGQVDLGQLINYVLGLMTLRKLGSNSPERDRFDDALQGSSEEFDQRISELATSLDESGRFGLSESLARRPANPRVRQSIAAGVMGIDLGDLGEATEYLLDRALRNLGRTAGELGYVGSKVSTILARAVASRGEPDVVYDPACGMAEVLMQVANQFPRTTLVGDEISVDVAHLAAQRAFLSGFDLDLTIGDTLAEHRDRPDTVADVVVVEPPFGMSWNENVDRFDPRWRYGLPTKRSSELLWIQHAIAHLKPGGVAFVVTPMRALFASGPDERVRRGLIEAGCVERIIALPGKLHPHTMIPLSLWVLRAASGDEQVTFVDASDQAEFGDGKVVDRVSELLSVVTGGNASTQSVTDVVLDGSNLLPSRWVASFADEIEDVAGEIESKNGKFTELLSAFSEVVIPDLAEHDEPRMERLDELRNLLTIVVGRGKEGEDTAVHSEPGDVILHTVSTLKAYVDAEGGRLLTGSIVALRLRDGAPLDPYYLAGVLTGGWNNRQFSGSAIMRVKPRELEIPVLPVEDQRVWGEFFRSVESIRSAVDSLGRFIDNEYIPTLQASIRSGYSPEPEPGPNEHSATNPKVSK